MSEKLIRGIVPALITPFDAENKVNVRVVPRLIERALDRGAAGFYITGYTGEGIRMTLEERKLMAETAVHTVSGQVPVIIHVGATQSTEDAVVLARHAVSIGADAVSSMAPITNPDSFDAALIHFKQIAEATELPFYAYQRGGAWSNVSPSEFLERMQVVPHFAGLKYTHGNLYSLAELVRLAGDRLNILSGPDELCIASLALGADGAIGSTYNVMMNNYKVLYDSLRQGHPRLALLCQQAANELIAALLKPDVGDIPGIKAILNAQGYEVGNPRLPLNPVSPQRTAELMQIVERNNLS